MSAAAPGADPLALSRLLDQFQSEARAAQDLQADPKHAALAESLRAEIANNVQAAHAYRILAHAYHRTKATGEVIELDDAIDYLDAVITPPLLPTGCSTLDDAVRFFDDRNDVDGAVQPELWRRARRVLLVARATALEPVADTHATTLRRYIDGQPRFAFPGRRQPQASADRAELDRRMSEQALRRALAHGLVYGVDPLDLMAAASTDRIGRIADDVRTALLQYRDALVSAGRPGLGRNATRLAAAAGLIAPEPPGR